MDEPTAANGAQRSEFVGGATLASPKVSQLERYANELSKQGELLGILESKLDTVSERSPQKGENAPITDRVHISTMNDILARNNRRINQIIDEVTL